MDEKKIKAGSTSKSVFYSTFFSLIARAFSFVQAMIVSYYFGATKSTDFLFFCISITMLLPGLFNNINQSVIVPNAIRIRESRSEKESRSFISYIYALYVIAGALICTIVFLMPERFMLIVSKFSASDIRENILIVKLIIPTFFFTLTNSYLLDVFNAYRYFTLPMILDMFKSILTIAFIVLLGRRFGIVSMATGILLAQIIQFIMLNGFLIRLFGLRFSLRIKRYRLDGMLQRNIFFVVISQVASIASQYVAIYLISGLSDGVYTAMSYSDKLYNIFVLVFAGQVATVLGIDMIELYARGEYKKLNEQYIKCIRIMMTVIIPVILIMAVKAPLIISVLFERGSFTGEAVELTSVFFKYAILIVPLLLLDRMIVRLIIAKQIMRISFIWNVICKALTCVVVYVVVEFMDFRYYGLGLLAVQLIYILLLNIFMVKRQFKFIRVTDSLVYVAVSAGFCTILCFGTAWLLPLPAESAGLLGKLVYLCVYSLVVMAGYYGIGFITYNRDTIMQLVNYIKQLLPKKDKALIPETQKSA